MGNVCVKKGSAFPPNPPPTNGFLSLITPVPCNVCSLSQVFLFPVSPLRDQRLPRGADAAAMLGRVAVADAAAGGRAGGRTQTSRVGFSCGALDITPRRTAAAPTAVACARALGAAHCSAAPRGRVRTL